MSHISSNTCSTFFCITPVPSKFCWALSKEGPLYLGTLFASVHSMAVQGCTGTSQRSSPTSMADGSMLSTSVSESSGSLSEYWLNTALSVALWSTVLSFSDLEITRKCIYISILQDSQIPYWSTCTCIAISRYTDWTVKQTQQSFKTWSRDSSFELQVEMVKKGYCLHAAIDPGNIATWYMYHVLWLPQYRSW